MRVIARTKLMDGLAYIWSGQYPISLTSERGQDKRKVEQPDGAMPEVDAAGCSEECLEGNCPRTTPDRER